MNFKKSFCWRSNFSNDGVISVFVNMYVAMTGLGYKKNSDQEAF